MIEAAIAVEGVKVLGDATERVPHIVALGIEGVEAEPVLLALDRAGIAAHSGLVMRFRVARSFARARSDGCRRGTLADGCPSDGPLSTTTLWPFVRPFLEPCPI